MRKKLFSTLLVIAMALTIFTLPAAADTAASSFTPITGWDMMEKLGVGISMSNTLEATGAGGLETSWGEVIIEQWHFEEIRSMGFDSVRIPVTWEPHIANHDFVNGKISDERMNRVQQVVDWALAEGFYVILNTHHERGFDGSLYGLIEDGKFEEGEAWIRNVWGQIADRFKDYPERLLFEPMNEPHLRDRSAWIWTPSYPTVNPNLRDGTNHLNNYALNFIRDRHPSHEKRVIIATVPGGNPMALRNYIHPERNGKPDEYSMAGIYFYDGDRRDWRDITNTIEKGIPIVVREIAPATGGGRPPRGTLEEWTTEWLGRFADLGIPCIWWNSRGGGADGNPWPRIFDRATNTWINQDLMKAFFDAYGKTIGTQIRPPMSMDFPFELASEGERIEGGFRYWSNVPSDVLSKAGKLVIEYSGIDLATDFTFTRFTSSWAQWIAGDSPITIEPGRLFFDIRGIAGNTIGFGPWDEDFVIEKAYLDTWFKAGGFTTNDALLILRASVGLHTLTEDERMRFGVGSRAVVTADALDILRLAIGL